MPIGGRVCPWVTRIMVTVTAAAGIAWAAGAAQPAVAAATRATGIAAGGGHACDLYAGHVWCWGLNSSGQLGDGTTISSDVPAAVAGGHTFTKISASSAFHTCALDTAGHAWCWGDNAFGQLGDGTTTSSDVPAAVAGGHTFTHISAGGAQTCALDTAGHAWCWGDNSNDQLGNGTRVNSAVPVAVTTNGVLAGKTLTQIAPTGGSACAIDTNGHAYCWGEGDTGALGNGALPNASPPVAVDTRGVLAGRTLTQISHTCVLDTTGRAYCWGDDSNGELGNGHDATQSDVPVRVLGRHLFTRINDGGPEVCAIDTAARAWCWGQNGNGQIGNGTITDDSVIPAAVSTSGVLAGKTITGIAAGGAFACGVSHGAVYCWGQGGDGQLGDGTTITQSDVPVTVLHPHG
jgi:alpha-tubulin suppressor-like RCC1 family protein